MGYDYNLKGNVISGNQIGRTIGFPTANIQINDSEKLIPKNGVYAVNIRAEDKVYNGMLNIGLRPTVGSDVETNIEVHIFDFNEDLYTKEIKIIFKKYIREERKFSDISKLKEQLWEDKQIALDFLK